MSKCSILLLLLIFLITGCGINEVDKGLDNAKGYTVIDESGRSLYLAKKPERIVSTTYGTDEILVELVELSRIKSFSKWAGDQEITFITQEQVGKVKNKVGENMEGIIALNPDIVFVSTSSNQEIIKTLTDMGITVYVASSPKTLEEMKQKIRGVSLAVGEPENGKKLIDKMEKKFLELENKLSVITPDKEKKVVAFSYIGAIGRKGNLLDNIINYAHVRNGAAEAGLDQGSNPLSKEKVVEINPDVILLPTWDFKANNNPDAFAAELLADPAFQNLEAIKKGKISYVPDRYRYVASQHITESIEIIAKTVYPELFTE